MGLGRARPSKIYKVTKKINNKKDVLPGPNKVSDLKFRFSLARILKRAGPGPGQQCQVLDWPKLTALIIVYHMKHILFVSINNRYAQNHNTLGTFLNIYNYLQQRTCRYCLKFSSK